jgi:uncharacterized protein with von Willebrand factor type A (vWA) domain
VHWSYAAWDASLEAMLESFQSLMSLFQYLLLMASGDVDQVFQWLRILQERGHLDPDIDLDEFRRRLEEDRIIERMKDGSWALGARGEQAIRRESLARIFGGLSKAGDGQHRVAHAGTGEERLTETRPYRFGDPVTAIDAVSTLTNAVRRGGPDDVVVTEEDLEVFETEHMASAATVLLIDISHSMILYGEDRITPAKQVALGLAELILTRFPKDSLRIGVFGDEAREVAVRDIPYLQVGPFHTNTKAGLEMAQSMLESSRRANRQIFMVTDGKPTAIEENGEIYKFPWGFDPKNRNQTLEAAAACRRAGITITTFMLASDPDLVDFVEEMSRIAHGRAYYASPDRLGEFIFADYIRNKRRTVT